MQQIGKRKGERRWIRRGIIIGRFGNKYDLVRFRCAYLEVDLDDMSPTSRLLEVHGCDGELRLHLPSTKFQIHYSVGSPKLICLSAMGNVISNRNRTTWSNTDTRQSHRAFYEPTRNQKIDIRELGGSINDFVGRLGKWKI